MAILMTGGAGQIGFHPLVSLLEADHEVVQQHENPEGYRAGLYI